MISPELSASMRTALVISYVAGPLVRLANHVVMVECGAPMECLWEAVETCARKGLFDLGLEPADSPGENLARRHRATLTPAGFNIAEEIIGPVRSRRIRAGQRAS